MKSKEECLNITMENDGPWQDLPRDLLLLISDRFPGGLRLRSVCTAWRSTVSPKPRFPPRLLHHSSGFYLSKRTVFALNLPSCDGYSASDGGSPTSWLIKLEDQADPGKMRLCSPLMAEYIVSPLPTIFPTQLNLLELGVVELGHEYIFWSYDASFNLPVESVHREKLAVCFLEEDDINHFVVLAIEFPGRTLSVYRAMDDGCIHKCIAFDVETQRFADLITFQGMFYVVDSYGTTHVIQPQSMEVTKKLGNKANMCGETKRLVECDGELLLIDVCTKIDCCDSDYKIRIKLFKLNWNRESWIESGSLGDHVVFLGEKSSFSTPASTLGCRGNRVVFKWDEGSCIGVRSDDDELGLGFIKVFDVGSGKLEDLKVVPELMTLFWPPPPWISTKESL